MKLIPEWRRAWRYASVQLATLATVFGVLPADQQTAMLDAVGIPPLRVPAILGGLFIASRLLKQKEQTQKTE